MSKHLMPVEPKSSHLTPSEAKKIYHRLVGLPSFLMIKNFLLRANSYNESHTDLTEYHQCYLQMEQELKSFIDLAGMKKVLLEIMAGPAEDDSQEIPARFFYAFLLQFEWYGNLKTRYTVGLHLLHLSYTSPEATTLLNKLNKKEVAVDVDDAVGAIIYSRIFEQIERYLLRKVPDSKQQSLPYDARDKKEFEQLTEQVNTKFGDIDTITRSLIFFWKSLQPVNPWYTEISYCIGILFYLKSYFIRMGLDSRINTANSWLQIAEQKGHSKAKLVRLQITHDEGKCQNSMIGVVVKTNYDFKQSGSNKVVPLRMSPNQRQKQQLEMLSPTERVLKTYTGILSMPVFHKMEKFISSQDSKVDANIQIIEWKKLHRTFNRELQTLTGFRFNAIKLTADLIQSWLAQADITSPTVFQYSMIYMLELMRCFIVIPFKVSNSNATMVKFSFMRGKIPHQSRDSDVATAAKGSRFVM